MNYKHFKVDLVAITVLAGMTAGVYFLRVEPARRDRDNYAQQNNELSARLAKINDLQGTLSQENAKLSAMLDEMNGESLRLQSASELNQMLARLTDLAVENGLQVDMIEPGRRQTGQRYGTIPIRMNGRGTYEDSARFVRNLRETLPDCGVRSMDLTGQPGLRPTPGTFNFELTWYTTGG